jgi:hypothetical protein
MPCHKTFQLACLKTPNTALALTARQALISWTAYQVNHCNIHANAKGPKPTRPDVLPTACTQLSSQYCLLAACEGGVALTVGQEFAVG